MRVGNAPGERNGNIRLGQHYAQIIPVDLGYGGVLRLGPPATLRVFTSISVT